MAATDKPHRNQKTLDMVFAVSCILMLLSVVWMMWADYNREYKNVGRLFRDLESVVAERQMIAQLPDPAEVEAAERAVETTTKAENEVKASVHSDDQRLTADSRWPRRPISRTRRIWTRNLAFWTSPSARRPGRPQPRGGEAPNRKGRGAEGESGRVAPRWTTTRRKSIRSWRTTRRW